MARPDPGEQGFGAGVVAVGGRREFDGSTVGRRHLHELGFDELDFQVGPGLEFKSGAKQRSSRLVVLVFRFNSTTTTTPRARARAAWAGYT